MSKFKNYIYCLLVKKNENIKYEYERYVMEHIMEHYERHLLHLKILFKLNWHYRIKKRKEPMIYWDRASLISSEFHINQLDDKEKGHIENSKDESIKISNEGNLVGPESKICQRKEPFRVAFDLLKYDVISFDIFDTLLFRAVAEPTDVFVLLEAQNNIFDFAQLRKDAESEARENCEILKDSRDVTINEIYEYVERETGISKERFVRQEFEMEKKLCFANDYMKDILEILLEHNKKVIFTSDMYYPSDMMKELLVKCEIPLPHRIYVSCDYRKSKRAGTLYKKIKSDLGDDISLCHIGDNRDVDINMAEQCGWNTMYYRNVNSIGKKYRPRDMSPLIRSVYSAVVNTWIYCSNRLFSPQYEYGYVYGGIYVLGYVNWIHDFAKRNNIQKVIFLARDSDILKDVYDSRFNDIESEYLYWGRLPSFKYMIKNDRYGFIRRNIADRVNRKSKITIGCLLELLNLEELIPFLKKYNLRYEDGLKKENAPLLKALFINYIEVIENKYEQESNIACEYVKYVIGDAEKIAIVDIGWKGTEPLCLKRLIVDEWKLGKQVECLMAGSYGNKWNVQDGTFNVFMFSQIHNVNNMNFLKKNISYYTLAFELFGRMRCEPRFKGFSLTSQNPHMRFEGNLVENHKDMKEMRKGIWDFVNNYCRYTKNIPCLQNISGFDAYAPSKMLVREEKYLDNYFTDHVIELDAGDNEGKIRTYKKYIEENKI